MRWRESQLQKAGSDCIIALRKLQRCCKPGGVGHYVVLPGPMLGVCLEPGAAQLLVDLGLGPNKVRLELRLLKDLPRQALQVISTICIVRL
jgi:hypothetical protein